MRERANQYHARDNELHEHQSFRLQAGCLLCSTGGIAG